MIPAFPILLALSLALGASVAVALRRGTRGGTGPMSIGLGTILSLEVAVFLPAGAYLLWKYPDWSLMYVADPAELPIPTWWLVAAYPVAAMLGFFVLWLLLRRGALAPALGLAASFPGAALAIGFLGRARLLVLGTTVAFRAEAAAQLHEVSTSPLLYAIVVVAVVLAVTWGLTVWRLWLYDRATPVVATAEPAGKRAPTLVRSRSNTDNSEGKNGKGKKKREAASS